MNIFSMMWRNLWGRARTLRYPARPAVSEGFRGLVHFDPSLCSGCAVCRMRCTARAINFTAGKGEFTWSYDPGHCTFCGRCVDGCKEHALHQENACPPIYSDLGALKQSFTLKRKPPAARPATNAHPSGGAASDGGAA